MTKKQSSPVTDSRIGSLNLHYEYKFYEDLVEPNGALTLDRRSHACWFYTQQAMRSILAWAGGAENQIIQYRVGDTPPEWSETHFEEIARSVALIYNLESPSEFLHEEWKKRVWAQAQELGLGIDLRIYDVGPGKARLS